MRLIYRQFIHEVEWGINYQLIHELELGINHRCAKFSNSIKTLPVITHNVDNINEIVWKKMDKRFDTHIIYIRPNLSHMY